MNKIEVTEKRPAYAITWQSMESVERYAANRYKHFDQRLVSWRERQIIDHFLKSLANNHQTILDIPTGYGRFTALFRRYGLGQINGDLNLYALLYHRQCHPDSRMSVVTNGNRLPFSDNFVDIVFNFRLLQHFKTSAERVALLSELARVTRKTIIISIYLESSFHRLTQKLSRRKHRMTLITRAQWEAELQTCGLRVIKMRQPLHLMHAQCIFWLEKTAVSNT